MIQIVPGAIISGCYRRIYKVGSFDKAATMLGLGEVASSSGETTS